MGKRGPKRLPEAIRAARGTLQRCRTNAEAPKGTDGEPPMPDRLDERERRMWATIVPNLAALGVLVHEHGLAVEMLVRSAVRYRRACEAVRTHGTLDESGARTGAARELDAAQAALLRSCQEFGITPSAATSVRAAPVVKDDAAARRRKRFAAVGAKAAT